MSARFQYSQLSWCHVSLSRVSLCFCFDWTCLVTPVGGGGAWSRPRVSGVKATYELSWCDVTSWRMTCWGFTITDFRDRKRFQKPAVDHRRHVTRGFKWAWTRVLGSHSFSDEIQTSTDVRVLIQRTSRIDPQHETELDFTDKWIHPLTRMTHTVLYSSIQPWTLTWLLFQNALMSFLCFRFYLHESSCAHLRLFTFLSREKSRAPSEWCNMTMTFLSPRAQSCLLKLFAARINRSDCGPFMRLFTDFSSWWHSGSCPADPACTCRIFLFFKLELNQCKV